MVNRMNWFFSIQLIATFNLLSPYPNIFSRHLQKSCATRQFHIIRIIWTANELLFVYFLPIILFSIYLLLHFFFRMIIRLVDLNVREINLVFAFFNSHCAKIVSGCRLLIFPFIVKNRPKHGKKKSKQQKIREFYHSQSRYFVATLVWHVFKMQHIHKHIIVSSLLKTKQ